MLMTMKSSQFQGSFRKVKPPTQNPLDRTLTVASNVLISSSEAGVRRLKTSEPTGGSRGAILALCSSNSSDSCWGG
ncbi:hypothetical protein EYF80_058060 [Liparis tanakae]|uniref:Uncharacterized protein n=1 Tax=Liparis tanakae TaxID=230148 RepID=A0A4Z2EU37_9TELE|nr:hypothetical protein EYF80_058060 [Liparis tanakae]